jgi:hypothetical protein
MLLGRLRCASFAHLKGLALGPAADHELVNALEWLVSNGMAQVVSLPQGRFGYTLTARCFRAVPQLIAAFGSIPRKISPAGAVHGWQRAALWAHYTRAGFLIATGEAALRPLLENRRAALRAAQDSLSATTIAALAAKVDEVYGNSEPGALDALEVAHREGECVILVADNPYRKVVAQLTSLPVAISAYDKDSSRAVYLPRLQVVFVPTDEESRWDEAKNTWGARGPRLRMWLRYTSDGRPHDAFPFMKVLESVDPPPAAILHRRRAPSRKFTNVSMIDVAAMRPHKEEVCFE